VPPGDEFLYVFKTGSCAAGSLVEPSGPRSAAGGRPDGSHHAGGQ